MDRLIRKSDVIKATHLEKYRLSGMAPAIMQLTGINRLNKVFGDVSDRKGLDFVNAFLDRLSIKFSYNEADLEQIPKSGAFVVVANHPYGVIDGMLMIKILCQVRPDFQVMANFLLSQVDNVKEFIVPVNPFENQNISSVAGLKRTMSILAEGQPIGIFPAGEVSTFQPGMKTVADREWQRPILKLIKKAEVPVIPMYFQGKNSIVFHLVGMIHPALRTACLPAEMFNKKHEIKIRIGKPISVSEQQRITDVKRYGRFLRAKTYAQGSSIEVKKFFRKPQLRLSKKPIPIIPEVPTKVLESEIHQLVQSGKKVNEIQDFQLFLAPSIEIPNILNQIGRLRELTFRAVGEGTNTSSDLDEYDLYYHHLFLWDTSQKQVCGAYRIGQGKEILERYHKQGFYIHSLFKIKEGFTPILAQSIELGRSFILPDYQRKRLPLYMLWQGILSFLMTHQEYRYLIGPVSISNSYSKISINLLVQFMMANYYNPDFAKYITPRKKFKLHIKNQAEAQVLLESTACNLKLLDKIIEDIEPKHFKVPVLLKKYLSLNAQIIGFNVDPKFSNSLDGLVLLDFKKVPNEVITNLKKTF